jgi:hypothetical protein
VRRNATPSSKGSGAGRGRRLRLTILVATAAAFLLVPVAQAAASTMTFNISGTGSGKVTDWLGEEKNGAGSPALECSYVSPGPTTGVCTNEMSVSFEGKGESGLHAYPAPGSEFAGWTIEEGSDQAEICNNKEFQEFFLSNFGYALCTVEATEGGAGNAKASVAFTKVNQFALTVAKTGEGTITSKPAGIVCGSECKAEFGEGSSVTLTASPASGYAFNSWAGCTEHVGLTCKVTMDKAKTVKASFIATPSFTIEKAGSGQGKAGATGISCDENCSTATSAIKTGTSVTVKVASAKGSEAASFEGGTGSASGCSGASCTFTISANSSVVVKFDPKPTKTLTVNLTGPAAYKGKVSGKGTVKGLTASAIACGAGCTTQTESFFASDTVTLTAVAGTGYKFAGWSGEEEFNNGTCTATTSPCTIPTNSNKTLNAKFE